MTSSTLSNSNGGWDNLKNPTFLRSFFYLALDVVSTFLIWAIGLFLVLSIAGIRDPINDGVLKLGYPLLLEILKDALAFTSADSGLWTFFGIYLYATYFTSLWILLYVSSTLFLRFWHSAGVRFLGLRSLFHIEEKPLRSIGIVCIALVTVVFAFLPFLREGEQKNSNSSVVAADFLTSEQE